jgi:L-asparaginase II
MPEKQFVPLVEVTRGGRVESYHWAALAVSDAEGRILAAIGDQQVTVFSRSAAKPFQTCALVRSGAVEAFSINDRELAVACSSHGGEPFHLQAVESLLRKGGFSAADLRCGLHDPWYAPVARELMQEERPPTTLHNNCSGKHAAMLALTRHLGADPREYLEPEGPTQMAILECLAEHTGLPKQEIHRALDGCSAPTFALPLASLARGYARLARCLIDPGFHPDLAAVARSMAKHPDLVAGTGRLETALMRARPGALIAKVGVEGIYAVAGIGPDGPVGLALKVADGDAERARGPLAIEALVRIGVLDRDAADGLREAFPRVLRTLAGQEVGTVKVKLPEEMVPRAK